MTTDEMNEDSTKAILKAIAAFRDRLPRATDEQAEAQADRLFAELSDRRAFVALWKKVEKFASEVRQAEFKSDVDRIWPESKDY
jgi:hypothetical protein